MQKQAIAGAVVIFGLATAMVLLTATPKGAQEATFKAPREISVVPGEILVKYKGMGLGRVFVASRVAKIAETHPVVSLATFPSFGVQHFKVQPGQLVEKVLSQLREDPLVEFAEPNYRVYAFQKVPNDPRWPELWGLAKVEMPKAWVRSVGSKGVVIAVIDTGVDYRHQDLAANMWKNPSPTFGDIYGANFCDGRRTGDPLDDNGHGTHVAGTIAAAGNNGVDVVGVGWQFQLMAVKFLCKDGTGNVADAIRAIEYALSNKAHILNNSWGGGGYSGALEFAIREADRQGVLFVAAAGNEASDNDGNPAYPASYRVPNVVAVAATTPQDMLAPFSNWGAKSVHLAAPGTSILSTVPNNKLATHNGTSMATPHVSGCAGLLKAIDLSRKSGELKKILLETADRVAGLAGRVLDGRLNCGKAATR